MLVAETYVGHRDDESVAARLSDADSHRVVLSDTDRRRSRVRTETAAGRDVGIVVARDLADGDVLETDDGDLVVVELAAVDAAVVSFEGIDVSPTAALEVGHALGNRHRDVAVRGDEVLVAVADARERTERTLTGLFPDGVALCFESVPPSLFDGTPDHGHGGHAHAGHSADGHAHDQPHEHGESHTHGDDGHGVRSLEGDG